MDPQLALRRLCARLLDGVAPSLPRRLLRATRAKFEHRCSSSSDSSCRRICKRPASFATARPSPWTASTPVRITPRASAASSLQAYGPKPGKTAGLHHQQLLDFRPPPSARSTKAAEQVEASSSSGSSSIFGSRARSPRHVGERGDRTQIWIACLGLRPRSPSSSEAPRPVTPQLYTLLQTLDRIDPSRRENAHTSNTCVDGRKPGSQRFA